ncbi:MAG TPA: hypothetical protein VJJ76_00560 [archaeon]|nr:hypothetical protein [archaeon]
MFRVVREIGYTGLGIVAGAASSLGSTVAHHHFVKPLTDIESLATFVFLQFVLSPLGAYVGSKIDARYSTESVSRTYLR